MGTGSSLSEERRYFSALVDVLLRLAEGMSSSGCSSCECRTSRDFVLGEVGRIVQWYILRSRLSYREVWHIVNAGYTKE